MISSRRIEETDRASVEQALSRDLFHQGTKADAFYEKGVITNVYEDELGNPILFLRASRSLRIDMCFVANDASKRNREAMLAGWDRLIAGAKQAGFAEITTSSNSPALVAFGCKVLGFEPVQTAENGEMALRFLL